MAGKRGRKSDPGTARGHPGNRADGATHRQFHGRRANGFEAGPFGSATIWASIFGPGAFAAGVDGGKKIVIGAGAAHAWVGFGGRERCDRRKNRRRGVGAAATWSECGS